MTVKERVRMFEQELLKNIGTVDRLREDVDVGELKAFQIIILISTYFDIGCVQHLNINVL